MLLTRKWQQRNHNYYRNRDQRGQLLKTIFYLRPKAVIDFFLSDEIINRSEVGPPPDVRTVRAVSIFYGIGQRYGSK